MSVDEERAAIQAEGRPAPDLFCHRVGDDYDVSTERHNGRWRITIKSLRWGSRLSMPFEAGANIAGAIDRAVTWIVQRECSPR